VSLCPELSVRLLEVLGPVQRVCTVPRIDGVSKIQSNRNARVAKQSVRLAKLVQQLLKGGSAAV